MSSQSYLKILCCFLVVLVVIAIAVSAVGVQKPTLKNNLSINKSQNGTKLRNITLTPSLQNTTVNVTPIVSSSHTPRGTVKPTTIITTVNKDLTSTQTSSNGYPAFNSAGSGQVSSTPSGTVAGATQTSDGFLQIANPPNSNYVSHGSTLSGLILGQAGQNQFIPTSSITTVQSTSGSDFTILHPVNGGNFFNGGGLTIRSLGSL